MNGITPESLMYDIQKGSFKPNIYLTNLAMAYFQDASRYVAKSIFPICPVQLSSARYYVFPKEDLLRDNVRPKPQFGKVEPAQFGHLDQSYQVSVDQIIVGVDQISALDYRRTNAPGFIDPRRAKARESAMVSVVLPTPPLPDATTMRFPIRNLRIQMLVDYFMRTLSVSSAVAAGLLEK